MHVCMCVYLHLCTHTHMHIFWLIHSLVLGGDNSEGAARDCTGCMQACMARNDINALLYIPMRMV